MNLVLRFRILGFGESGREEGGRGGGGRGEGGRGGCSNSILVYIHLYEYRKECVHIMPSLHLSV